MPDRMYESMTPQTAATRDGIPRAMATMDSSERPETGEDSGAIADVRAKEDRLEVGSFGSDVDTWAQGHALLIWGMNHECVDTRLGQDGKEADTHADATRPRKGWQFVPVRDIRPFGWRQRYPR